jgi:hypothetical protein
MNKFDEWWFSSQFDQRYWELNSHLHPTEYNWAKLAFRAGMLAAAEIANEQAYCDDPCESRSAVTCPDIICALFAIRKAADAL